MTLGNDDNNKRPGNIIDEAMRRALETADKLASWQPAVLGGRRKERGPVRYASFNDRVFASVIDVALLFLTLIPFFSRISAGLYQGIRQDALRRIEQGMPPSQVANIMAETGFLQAMLLDYAIHYIVFGLIVLWFWNRAACTPGKWLLKMRIVDQETYCKPSFKQLLTRYLGYIPALLPLSLGILWVAINKKRRGWQDMLAGTAVVKVDHWQFRDDGTTPHIVLEEGEDKSDEETEERQT